MALVRFENVYFKYKKNDNLILNNVNMLLNEGQIVGLLGPNGSGKTTIIKLLAGLLKNHMGNIYVNEKEIGPISKSIVSYLPDTTYLDENTTILETINMFKQLYDDFDINKMFSLLNTMNLNEKSLIKTLSKGNKEKLQLALVLSRRAKVYILDEPIGGVDPAQRDFILNTIINNYAKDSLVIISTHLIDDVESILSRAIFINKGTIIIDDSKENIIAMNKGKSLNEVFKEVFKCQNY